jgi:hypothetical protein
MLDSILDEGNWSETPAAAILPRVLQALFGSGCRREPPGPWSQANIATDRHADACRCFMQSVIRSCHADLAMPILRPRSGDKNHAENL